MSVPNPADISPYGALTAHVRAMLGHPGPSATPVTLEAVPDVSVLWCWDSPTQGRLIADIAAPRLLNVATLTHLASIALPSAVRYPAIVIADQRKHRLRLCHSNLDADVVCVMPALESLLNQCDVLTTLLIDGPPGKAFKTPLAKHAETSYPVW
jgi:hypothetical protein